MIYIYGANTLTYTWRVDADMKEGEESGKYEEGGRVDTRKNGHVHSMR